MSSESGRPRLQISIQQPWFATISATERALVSLALGGFVFLSGGVLDWFVTRQYLPGISLMLAGAAVALAVGLLVFQILTDIQGRYQAILDQLRRIAELNHHIRNALQVIAYHNLPARGERAIQQVNAEVLRIESVLREVSAALGTHADFPAAIVPIERRNV
jgi:hypothetical protein